MRRPILWLLGLSACLKLAYVFFLTDYPNYLFSDFGGYWDRALNRFHDNDFDFDQWSVWPPLAHILLSWYMRFIKGMGLGAWPLHAALTLNVLASTASVAALYGIGLQVLKSRNLALALAGVYAFTFPLIYFNAFVMSEHAAIVSLLTAVWMTLRFRRHAGMLALAGAMLGLTVGLRPAFGLYGLVFAIFIVAADWFDRRTIARAALFSLGFFVIVGAVVAENHRISRGQVTALGANGGINFYFSHCRTHQVTAHALGYDYILVPPETVDKPENGHFVADHPFHDQAYFTGLGWECVRRNPAALLTNLTKYRNLFFGPLLPSVSSAWGFDFLLTPFQWFFLACALLAPLAVFVRPHESEERAGTALLCGLIGTSLLTMYIFNAEHRYLYPLLALWYLAAAGGVREVIRQWPHSVGAFRAWAIVLGGAFLIGIGIAVPRWLVAPSRIAVEIKQTPVDLIGPASTNDGVGIAAFKVDSLRFPSDPRLRHYHLGDKGAYENVAILFDTCIDVPALGEYEFQVVSDGAFTLELGGVVVLEFAGLREYSTSRVVMPVNPGKYRYRLRYLHGVGDIGVVATWRHVDDPLRDFAPALGLHYIGESGDEVNFYSPEACKAQTQHL